MSNANDNENSIDIEEDERLDEDTRLQKNLSFVNAYKIPHRKTQVYTTLQTVMLGYQSLGVVFGDLGTSPLYVFSSISMSEPGEKDILGIFSLIFWTLTMIGLIKYVLIVLQADDHGEGGTFALYSFLRQHVNFKGETIMPSTRLGSDINLAFHSKGSTIQSKAKKLLEESVIMQNTLTITVLIGTCMVIGDGALTPAISVLSATQGIQSRSSNITQDHIVIISVIILAVLFLFQRYGTSKVSASFSPIMLLWFVFNAAIGIYNMIKFYPSALKGLSPHYTYFFFKKNRKTGWELLGEVALCITGAEAMFADLGHFNKLGIQMSFSFVVYPALILTYGGQVAYLIKNPDGLSTAFYSSIPRSVFWPMFVIATLAAIVASQALISASFSIIRQSMSLGCFPRVSMLHTSKSHEGQVYSPEINYFLMITCILLTIGFEGGKEIGNAYGVAVIWVMLITTLVMAVVMLIIWSTNIILVAIFFLVFVGIEGIFMSALLKKVPKGGWVPFAISCFFLVITLSWTYGRSKKKKYEAGKKMDRQEFNQLVTSNTISRVPGICFFCTELINGIPPIIRHYVNHVGTLRDVTVLVTVRTLPVKSVLPEERFLVGRLAPRGLYRCLVQYGYMDKLSMEGEEYVTSVINALKEIAENDEEIAKLNSGLNDGVVFVLGRIIMKAGESQGCFKQLVINTLYRFLQKNFRSNIDMLKIPPSKILQVGMLYEI